MAYTPNGVPTQGIGFAIPARTVAEKVEQFKHDAQNPDKGNTTDLTQATRKRLGLTFQELTSDLSDALGVPSGRGVLVSDVEPEGPAARSGLRRGLVVYKVGRYDVNSPADVETLLRRAKQGAPVDLSVGVLQHIGGNTFQQIQTVSIAAR